MKTDQKLLHIIGAALRYSRNGGDINRMPVQCWRFQFGITRGFASTSEFEKALKDLLNWVYTERFVRGKSPEIPAMLKFFRNKLGK